MASATPSPSLAFGYEMWAILRVCDGWPDWIRWSREPDPSLMRVWQEAHVTQEYPL